MTYRKLVELDEGGCSIEIDRVKLKRVAAEFRNWLNTVNPNNDPHGFLRWDLPLVNSALNETLELPYHKGNPHNWEIREGHLDWYLEIAAPFYNLIRGMDLVVKTNIRGEIIGRDIVERDGKRYAWAEFEDAPQESPPS